MKKRHYIIISLILFLSFRLVAQSPETIYPGNVAKAGYDNNASYGPFNIGFNFTYFGNTYSQFYVTSNGLVMFGSGSTSGKKIQSQLPQFQTIILQLSGMIW